MKAWNLVDLGRSTAGVNNKRNATRDAAIRRVATSAIFFSKRNIFSLDLYNYLMQVCVDYGQFQIASNARQLQIDANS